MGTQGLRGVKWELFITRRGPNPAYTGPITMYQRILLGISGSIAASKTPDLVRRLRDAGAEVQVVLTRGAMEFVDAAELRQASGRPVPGPSPFDQTTRPAGDGVDIEHIDLARWADCVLIAPASANTLARLAHGLADDLLSSLCLAATAPLFVAPAMNTRMWEHPATRANMESLAARGTGILGPAHGELACGETGLGRMLEPVDIVQQLAPIEQDLAGIRVLITAGPTREALDPVRYLSNHSSGRMGLRLAEAFARRGATVTLVAGPVSDRLRPGSDIRRIDVTSALDMHQAVMAQAPGQDIFIAAAAVADYRPAAPREQKIKKGDDDSGLTLSLVRNPDILAEVCHLQNGPYCVGFAAETEQLERYAREKLARKGAQMIIANRVGAPRGGFDRDENEVTVFRPGQDTGTLLPMADKAQIAGELVSLIADAWRAAQPA